jgi:hypothetical protein
MNSLNESKHIINNMLQDTIILQRRDKEETKRLRESWVEFGIILDNLNKDLNEFLRGHTKGTK